MGKPKAHVRVYSLSWFTSSHLALFLSKLRKICTSRASRNPGRRDGFLWNADTFLCPAEVDGFRRDVSDAAAAIAPNLEERHWRFFEEEGDWLDSLVTSTDGGASRSHEVAILNIARYAKLKGVAREFEVMWAPRRTIALDEDAFLGGLQFLEDDDEDLEWQDIDIFDSNADLGEAEYLLARHLRDEKQTTRHPLELRGAPGTQRKAYADVLRGSDARTTGGLFFSPL
ncbi:hypothetical protein C8R43DRAFT_567425 [Mycena crocata]|nr:hypothetical protein C8R43DRAFT_567425 [Mycena crocata]